ncbi:bifunctional molybdenum cofactor biosynthesis protein MoaC/MoaB [soil metagenome]
MIDITYKHSTLRRAIATAIVKVSKPETIAAIKNKTVPKGDVLEMAKTAGLFGVKKTAEMIPDCHPMPVEFTAVRYEVGEMEVKIEMEVATIYKTGVEVEAMHGASVVALTMYDMLKPIDKGIEISSIKLQEKSGGKSDFANKFRRDLKAAVIVCSDTISAGTKEDKAGKAIITKLESCHVAISEYIVIPDEKEIIRNKVIALCDAGNDMVILTGGTGLSPRDVTPEALKDVIEREIPGITEYTRSYGQDRTPYSMLSRSVAGLRGKTLILALPGSTKGASESMDALFPNVLHLFKIVGGGRHD